MNWEKGLDSLESAEWKREICASPLYLYCTLHPKKWIIRAFLSLSFAVVFCSTHHHFGLWCCSAQLAYTLAAYLTLFSRSVLVFFFHCRVHQVGCRRTFMPTSCHCMGVGYLTYFLVKPLYAVSGFQMRNLTTALPHFSPCRFPSQPANGQLCFFTEPSWSGREAGCNQQRQEYSLHSKGTFKYRFLNSNMQNDNKATWHSYLIVNRFANVDTWVVVDTPYRFCCAGA